VAALYGHDPADPRVAADFLILRGVHTDPEQALADLEVVRATPLPPPGERTPLKSWYEAIVRILIIAGFLSAPEEEETKQLTRWAKAMRAVRFVVAGLIWALTWVLPVTFMIMMSWACESDARRFGQRATTHYGEEGDDIAIAIASADRKAGGNRALTVARGALVVLSLAIPLAFIAATVAGGKGPLGVNVRRRPEHSPPSRWSLASALPPCEAEPQTRGHQADVGTTTRGSKDGLEQALA
jgi:hypothetical protein